MDDIRPQDQWLQDRYAEFYAKNTPPLPDRFGRREFAFIFFGQKFMLRHLGLKKKEDFGEFLARRGPAHAYYSTAFYKTPDAPTMSEKGWLGAELIFDLDADHVPGAEKLPYKQQLAEVKEHFLYLVEDFILNDFGFQEKDLLLTFSGGRGYHCHVLNERAFEMSSSERREIVDYVTGTGLDIGKFVHEKVVDRKGTGRFAKNITSWRLSAADSPGWGARINRGWVDYLEALRGKTKEELVTAFADVKGVGEKGLTDLFIELRRLDSRRQLQGMRELQGFIEWGPKMGPWLAKQVVSSQGIVLRKEEKGETDEPVTSDTKRLIRLPGSLHGKSGLRVVTLRLDEIRDFDPLVDAVAFGNDLTRINVLKPSNVEVGGSKLDLPTGEAKVPEAAAVMLVARGAAVPLDLG